MANSRARFELAQDTARAIAAAATAVPGVAQLNGGRYGENALLYAGHRVVGLKRPNPRDDSHLQVFFDLDLDADVPVFEAAKNVQKAAMREYAELKRVDAHCVDAVVSSAPGSN